MKFAIIIILIDCTFAVGTRLSTLSASWSIIESLAPQWPHVFSKPWPSPSGLPFQAMLRKQRYDKALEFLKSQTPSGVHLALEQIGPMASGDDLELQEGHWYQMIIIQHFQGYMSTPAGKS